MKGLGALGLVGVITTGCLFVFIGPILGVFFGALGGWLVGLVFEETVLAFFAAFGVTGLSMWQVGAGLGFVSMFFKSYSSSNSN